MKRTAKLSDIISPLGEKPSQAYISNALQVADILEWILSSPRPSSQFAGRHPHHPDAPGGRDMPTVRQTTFSISEEFLRRTYFIKKRHPARFIVIIDRKALRKTVQLWRFIAQVYDEVWIADNHSKILLVDFPGGDKAALVTSQNLTRGNRAESAVISSDNQIYCSLMKDFEDLRKNNSAPMHEIMPTGATLKENCEAARQTQPPQAPSEIERLAGYFVPISDIATILGLDPIVLRDRIADTDSPESLAYRRGKAKAKVALKAQEMELARVGSPLGMQSVRENLLIMESDED